MKVYVRSVFHLHKLKISVLVNLEKFVAMNLYLSQTLERMHIEPTFTSVHLYNNISIYIYHPYAKNDNIQIYIF